MVSAIRAVTIERGVDPRPCVLVSGGGAGSLHAARLATALGIGTVLIPREAGVLSAYGMTVSDLRHDHSATLHTTSARDEADRVAAVVGGLEERAREELARDGFAEATRIERTVDARYLGQIHELMTPVPDGPVDADLLARLRTAFDELHRERYSYDLPDVPVEYLHWRVAGIGVMPPAPRDDYADLATPTRPASASRTRRAWFAELGGWVDAAVHDSGDLARGDGVEGPAIVESTTTTVLVPPGCTAIADGHEGLILRTPAAST
jgi:N-methylhydantoinase A